MQNAIQLPSSLASGERQTDSDHFSELLQAVKVLIVLQIHVRVPVEARYPPYMLLYSTYLKPVQSSPPLSRLKSSCQFE
ncbi:hypothetical protein MAR_024140, partial [Mya arenaria]